MKWNIRIIQFALAFIFLLFQAHPVAHVSEPPEPAGTPDEFTGLYDEPVFNGKFFLYESGDRNKETVVLVHGIGNEGARCFDSLLGDLTNRYRVVTFDLPGFGRSTRSDSLYSPERYVKFLKWVADRFAKGKFILAGHSMGGALVLKYAARYPDSVSRLILIDVAGILHWGAISKFMVEITPRLSVPFLPDRITDILTHDIGNINNFSSSVIFNTGNDATAEAMHDVLHNDLSRKIIFRQDASKIAGMALVLENYTSVFSGITMPCRILWGEHDKTTPRRTANLLRYKIAGSTLRIIPDSGHSPMFDNPRLFREYFLDALTSPDAAVPSGQREGTNAVLVCKNENNRTYSGSYDSVSVSNSKKIILKDIFAQNITIVNSDVTIENAGISSDSTALRVSGSKLTVTGAHIEGDTAILTKSSRLDFAGVSLKGKRYAVAAIPTPEDEAEDKDSTALFSVCDVKSPRHNGSLHGIWSITPDDPL